MVWWKRAKLDTLSGPFDRCESSRQLGAIDEPFTPTAKWLVAFESSDGVAKCLCYADLADPSQFGVCKGSLRTEYCHETHKKSKHIIDSFP
jgi:hypothetical protein